MPTHFAGAARRPTCRGRNNNDDGRRAAPNQPGLHFLRSPRIIHGLVAASGVSAGDLVLDLGAGHGALTDPLSATGARVVAIERDPALVRSLQRRFDAHPGVRIVEADLRTVPLPRRPYAVVASVPYSISSLVLRRLLGPPETPLRRADLVVDWGFARLVTTRRPRSRELAWWMARFDLRVLRRVPAGSFVPSPSVDSAHLEIRPVPGMSRPRTQQSLWALLTEAYLGPEQPLASLLGSLMPRRAARQVALELGAEPGTPVRSVAATQWAAAARAMAGDASIRLAPLPRWLGAPSR